MRLQKALRLLILPALFITAPLVAAAADERPAKEIDAASYDAEKAITRNLETHTFLGLGPTIGAPAGLNANLTFYSWRLMLSAAGMFYGTNWYGAQGDLGFVLFSGPRLRHTLAFSAGLWRYAPLLTNDAGATVASYFDTKYVGGSYTLFNDGFFLQLGAGAGFGDNKNPVLIFQAGYLLAIGH